MNKAIRACPSALAAKQLGLVMHELGRTLPLSDGVTGRRVDDETDQAR